MSDHPLEKAHSREVGEALNLLMQALELLDDNKISGEIGAHLDLAICRLSELLGIPAQTL